MPFANCSRRQILLLFTTFWLVAMASAAAVTAGSYREFADGLNDSPPAGSIYRPDLEERLVDLANAYRGEEGKGALKADPLFQRAARRTPRT